MPTSPTSGTFRIVDGELHARSRVGMLGYHGDAEAGDADGWRPTGDLVEIDGDRILFAGRTSEVINVGGVKVHPLRVEEVAIRAACAVLPDAAMPPRIRFVESLAVIEHKIARRVADDPAGGDS